MLREDTSLEATVQSQNSMLRLKILPGSQDSTHSHLSWDGLVSDGDETWWRGGEMVECDWGNSALSPKQVERQPLTRPTRLVR